VHPSITASRCYDAVMRTTIDLPDDLHERAARIARATSRTLSETVAELVRRGLERHGEPRVERSPRTGLPVVTVGRPINGDDVASLED
jgi:Arc/MetJ family transcription regulator